jgi:hypothetical protein
MLTRNCLSSDIHFLRAHPAVELIEENQVVHVSTYKTATCQSQDDAIWVRAAAVL